MIMIYSLFFVTKSCENNQWNNFCGGRWDRTRLSCLVCGCVRTKLCFFSAEWGNVCSQLQQWRVHTEGCCWRWRLWKENVQMYFGAETRADWRHCSQQTLKNNSDRFDVLFWRMMTFLMYIWPLLISYLIIISIFFRL